MYYFYSMVNDFVIYLAIKKDKVCKVSELGHLGWMGRQLNVCLCPLLENFSHCMSRPQEGMKCSLDFVIYLYDDNVAGC